MTELAAVMTTPQHTPFRIALTADFYDEAGTPRYADFGLDTFAEHDHIVVSQFAEHRGEITPDQLAGDHAALVLTPKVTANSLAGCEDLLAISRFGVGYDSVDVEACTANNVLVTGRHDRERTVAHDWGRPGLPVDRGRGSRRRDRDGCEVLRGRRAQLSGTAVRSRAQNRRMSEPAIARKMFAKAYAPV